MHDPSVVGTTDEPRRSVASDVLLPSDSRMSFRVLAGMLLGSSAFALLFAAFPSADTGVRSLDFVVGVLLGLVGLFVLFVAPRTHGRWGLDVAVALSYVTATIGVMKVQSSDGQMLIALGLVLFAVFAAYFLPARRFRAHLVAMLGCYLLAVLVHPIAPSPIEYVVVLFAIAAASLTVSHLVGQLRAIALYDSLTGLLNRRGLDELSPLVAATAVRAGAAVTVGIIDLDDFKGYNDTFGHLAGDRVLVEVARAWQSELRASDLLARFGGDEYAVILPGSTTAEAHDLGERVRSGNQVSWTAGFTRWSPDEGLYAALERADAEMFRGKRDDQVISLAEPGEATVASLPHTEPHGVDLDSVDHDSGEHDD